MTDTVTEAGPPLIDFDNIVPTPSSEFLEPEEPDTDFVDDPGKYDEPSPDVLTERKRSPKAKANEKKVGNLLNGFFRTAISNPNTVPDAAAIAMHVQPVSEAWGDLAAADPRVERAIDWLTDGTENPYLTAVLASAPLVLQLIRNHEPVLEPKVRGFRIPFGKRKGERVQLKLKLGIRLGGFTRNFTNDPRKLESAVFDNPAFMAAMEKQGLTVVRNTTGR